MAGPRITIGYKPATDPVGWGGDVTTAGKMRGTSFPGRGKGYWIARIGGRVGRFTGTNTTMRFAAFKANKSSQNPENRLGNTNTFLAKVAMADRVSGANYEQDVLEPIAVSSGQPVTLSALGTGAAWAHGQDHSGALMYERGGLSGGLPTTFGSTNTRPEGKMSLWGVAYEDVKPEIPLWIAETGGVSPGHGHSITDDTPTIAFDFRSSNELLPGFDIGDADKMTKYQVQIWNSAKTAKLQDSGLATPNGTMVNNRRVTWTAGALAPGRYVVRAQVYNTFNTPSDWREWTINIVGAGSLTITAPVDVINDASPDFTWNYSHRQGLAMDKMTVRIMNAAATEIIRPDSTFDFSVDPVDPSNGILPYDATGWADLPVGADYSVLAHAIDTDGQPSPWSAPLVFHVNAPPFVPINRTPTPGTVTTSVPELAAMARDADNAAATTPTYFEVRRQGETESETRVGIYDRPANRWRLNLLTEGMVSPGDYDFYEWRVQSIDSYGAVGPWSDWLTFEYVAPPTITIVTPVDTIDVANPAFSWTIDRAQVQYRIQLLDAIAGDPIRNGDTGWITSAVTEHNYSQLLLRHDQDVRARLDVITTGGVPGVIEWEFDVLYTPPATVTGVVAEPYKNEFDFQGTATSVKVTWDAVATPEIEFDSYLVRRVDTITGETVDLVALYSTTDTEWIDDTAAAGVVYEYQVIQYVIVALDFIPSIPGVDTAMVEKIVGIVVSPVIGGGGRVVLPFLNNVNVEPQVDRMVRPSWASRPRISSGPMDYAIIPGTAYMIPDLAGEYTAADVQARVHAIAKPFVDADGLTRARTLCLRMWDGRVFYGCMTSVVENSRDEHVENRTINFEFTENNYQPGGVR